jgi:hypothetical protein
MDEIATSLKKKVLKKKKQWLPKKEGILQYCLS